MEGAGQHKLGAGKVVGGEKKRCRFAVCLVSGNAKSLRNGPTPKQYTSEAATYSVCVYIKARARPFDAPAVRVKSNRAMGFTRDVKIGRQKVQPATGGKHTDQRTSIGARHINARATVSRGGGEG